MTPAPRILLFACDPGGANTLVPLVKPLQASGCDVLLLGKQQALQKYREAGLSAEDITSHLAEASTKDWPLRALDFLKAMKPDFVLTGTSANDFTEKFLWWAAETLEIPSMALLDHWVNYGIRFSYYGVQDMAAYLKEAERANAGQAESHPARAYLPRWIGVMDEPARQEAITDGVPEERIVITGQPYFETIREDVSHIDSRAIRQQLGIAPEDCVLLFASEPLALSYGSDAMLGYTEVSILSQILDALMDLEPQLACPVTLVVKLHPKNEPQTFDRLLKEKPLKKIHVRVEQAMLPRALLAASDWVLGMASMLLMEAAICGKQVTSVQIGLKTVNPLVLCRMGLIAPILSQEALRQCFQQGLVDGKLEAVDFPVQPGAVRQICDLVHQQLPKPNGQNQKE